MDEELLQRVTVLETNHKVMMADSANHRRREEEYMKSTRDVLQEIRDKQAKQQGFYAGAIFVISGIVTLVGVFANKILGVE